MSTWNIRLGPMLSDIIFPRTGTYRHVPARTGSDRREVSFLTHVYLRELFVVIKIIRSDYVAQTLHFREYISTMFCSSHKIFMLVSPRHRPSSILISTLDHIQTPPLADCSDCGCLQSKQCPPPWKIYRRRRSRS